ncbi:MAG: hypothetical protein H7A53_05340 [Akkermansiaceae bacterium]|nr:hypothetical protein [Akkermansiaceae bacterium]MCP5550300.1 hypothetical protein [Akkermansiaceae bacterium]
MRSLFQTAFLSIVLSGAGPPWARAEDDLLLSDEVVPWEELGADFPERPKPVTETIEDSLFPQNRERDRAIREAHGTGDASPLETASPRRNLFGGNPFLASGELYRGFELPTGAVWQPVFILYGQARTAVQTFDNGLGDTTEWANWLDLFGNLYLTPTERVLFGLRPLDRDGEFTGYQFEGDDEGGFETFSARIQTLFFEGDFGELFPNLDPRDEKHFDYGFAIGRQPLDFQDGILINDAVDSIGVSRASLFAFGANAARITALAGFNQVHRGDNVRDPDAFIYGLLTSMDYDRSTLEIDLVYVDGDPLTGGDGFFAGVGDTRRIGQWNSTLRFNYSWALDEGSPAIDTGGVVTSQLSRTVTWNDDLFYFDTFFGFGDFTSAARDPAVGGPLGTIGILYSSAGLSDFGTPLGNQVGDAVGFAMGYQHYFGQKHRAQIIPEIGGRLATEDGGESSLGFAVRYQRAFGRHSVLQVDGFVAGYDDESGPFRDDFGYGLRCEWLVKF